jgi:hypothetical protein
VVDAARVALGAYLDDRLREGRSEVIDGWKAQRVYPYDAEPRSQQELQERRLFDAIAVTAAPAVGKDTKTAKLSLRLIKEALESSPRSLPRVLYLCGHNAEYSRPGNLRSCEVLVGLAAYAYYYSAGWGYTRRPPGRCPVWRCFIDALAVSSLDLSVQPWTPQRVAGPPAPEQAPALAVPAQHFLGPEQEQVASPVPVQSPHEEPGELVPSSEPRTTPGAESDLELLAKEQVLDDKALMADGCGRRATSVARKSRKSANIAVGSPITSRCSFS